MSAPEGASQLETVNFTHWHALPKDWKSLAETEKCPQALYVSAPAGASQLEAVNFIHWHALPKDWKSPAETEKCPQALYIHVSP